MTKEQLQTIVIESEKKILSLEKRLKKCREKDNTKNTIYRIIIGFAAMVSAQWIPNTGITTQWFTGDVVVNGAVILMLAPTLLQWYKNYKESKAEKRMEVNNAR